MNNKAKTKHLIAEDGCWVIVGTLLLFYKKQYAIGAGVLHPA
jgi:hypothetical protein